MQASKFVLSLRISVNGPFLFDPPWATQPESLGRPSAARCLCRNCLFFVCFARPQGPRCAGECVWLGWQRSGRQWRSGALLEGARTGGRPQCTAAISAAPAVPAAVPSTTDTDTRPGMQRSAAALADTLNCCQLTRIDARSLSGSGGATANRLLTPLFLAAELSQHPSPLPPSQLAMNFARSTGRPAKAAAAAASGSGTTHAPPGRKPAVPSRASAATSGGPARVQPCGRDLSDTSDLDESLDDSLDEAKWEAELHDRHAFLQGLGAGAAAAAASSLVTAAEAQRVQPAPQLQPSRFPQAARELGGLDDDDDDCAAAHSFASPTFVASPQPSVHPCVPSLFSLAVEQLGLQFAAIGAQDVQQRLPPGTLRAALLAVRKAERLDDSHLPLLFRTLASAGANQVCSRSWLEKDCGLDALVSSSLDGEADEAGTPSSSAAAAAAAATAASSSVAVPSPSASAPAASSTTKPRSATAAKISAAPRPTVIPAANARFAPLKGTPGVSTSLGHSMNTATLARAAKAQKLAAQIAASNLQPHARPNVSAQVASVKSQQPAVRVGSALLNPAGRSGGGPLVPREYLIATGEQLDLRAQHRLTEAGFRTLAALMEYTRDAQASKGNGSAMAQGPAAVDHSAFTLEQQARLAAADVSPELRALVRSVLPSAVLGPVISSTTATGSSTGTTPLGSLSLPETVDRLGIWRPVNVLFLDVSFTGITSAALQLVARQCPNLLKINISGCDKVNGRVHWHTGGRAGSILRRSFCSTLVLKGNGSHFVFLFFIFLRCRLRAPLRSPTRACPRCPAPALICR